MTGSLQADLVSVVIPVFNNAGTVSQTVDSVIEDQWPRKEIVLVNDGSTDDTPAVIEQLKRDHPEIIQTIHQDNAGANCARNRGLRHSSGRFLQFLDADDRMLNNKLQESMKRFKESRDLVCVYTDGVTLKSGNTIGTVSANDSDVAKLADRSFELFSCGLNGNLPIWNRNFLIEHDLYWDERLKCWQETEFHLRVLTHIGDSKRVLHLPEVHYERHVHEGSISSRYFSEEYILGQQAALIAIRDYLMRENLWKPTAERQWNNYQTILLKRSVICNAPGGFHEVRHNVRETGTGIAKLMATMPFQVSRLAYVVYKNVLRRHRR